MMGTETDIYKKIHNRNYFIIKSTFFEHHPAPTHMRLQPLFYKQQLVESTNSPGFLALARLAQAPTCTLKTASLLGHHPTTPIP